MCNMGHHPGCHAVGGGTIAYKKTENWIKKYNCTSQLLNPPKNSNFSKESLIHMGSNSDHALRGY